MAKKIYYAERNGELNNEAIDLKRTIKLFVNIFNILTNELYFHESTGYDCPNGGMAGKWGNDFESFIFSKTGIQQLWPISEESYIGESDCFGNYEGITEVELFTIIEFLYQYVSEPVNPYKCRNWYCNSMHCDNFDPVKGKLRFREEINNIITRYNEGFTLTEDGEVHKLAPSGLKELLEERIETDDKTNIDDRINSAISQYFRFKSTIEDKKAAILSLGGVLEYLKTTGVKLESSDSNDLFQIMNKFDLRHHQKIQLKDYEKEEWYEWFFYTFLSSIRLLLKLNKNDK